MSVCCVFSLSHEQCCSAAAADVCRNLCDLLCCAVLCCAYASDLLGDPRRFAVMSIESKLLVLLPTLSGQMVAICPKDVANSEELTNDVVKTIMAVSRSAVA